MTQTLSFTPTQIKTASEGTGHYMPIPKGRKAIKVSLKSSPRKLLEFLSTMKGVPSAKKNTLKRALKEIESTPLLDRLVGSPLELHDALHHHLIKNYGHGKPNMEVRLPNGGWYPIIAASQFNQSFFGQFNYIRSDVKICDHVERIVMRWTEGSFTDEAQQPIRKSVRDLLSSRNLRLLTPERLAHHKEKRERTRRIAEVPGTVLDCNTKVLYLNKFLWMQSLDVRHLGEDKKPSMVLSEAVLESKSHDQFDDGDEDVVFELPFLRVFSLELKKYVYVDVDDVKHRVFRQDARERLVLEPELRKILDSIFEAHSNTVFGDMFHGRHGGMVVLANGPSGVGKTLTAEVFAEYTERPLYVLEMGELGTSLDAVEENLQLIFARAARWNAVLLFDEADIFLAKRQETDLERSAIVGVFLRLLDQYQGMFFLTTNRAEVMDPAFKSRITLKLDYPNLTIESRQKVWELMTAASGISLTEGTFEGIAKTDLNGRQIRNQVRLLNIVHPNGQVTESDVASIIKYVAR